MSTTQLILMYLGGWASSVYVGMRLEAWRSIKHRRSDVDRAFNRGFNTGRKFLDRVRDEKLDADSAVRILTGEDADEDRPFPRS